MNNDNTMGVYKISNYLKAALFTTDISQEHSKCSRENGYTIQYYTYHLGRTRDTFGYPYGPTLQTIFKAVVKLPSMNKCKIFYEQLQSSEQHTFSFVFNAAYDDNNCLKEWDNAMIVNAYVVGIDENYNSTEDGYVNIELELLVSSIIYKGSDSSSDRCLEIVKNN